MRKSLGSKRKELSPAHIEDITRLFGSFEESSRDGVPISRIFKNEDFGYRTLGGILDILLNHSHLYETLRARAAG